MDILKKKFSQIKAFVSDWDGVFNTGVKNPNLPSSFSEADSMGLNLVRYEFFKRLGFIPPVGIITGAENPSAMDLANREKFQAVYSQIVNKHEAILHFCDLLSINPENIAVFFDDVNDLGMAKLCGVRILIPRVSSPLFTQFVEKNNFCDYTAQFEGGKNAIREVCEHFLDISGNYEKVMMSRANFDEDYQQYFNLRQTQTQQYFKKIHGAIVEIQH